ncbi:MAG TPA: SEC-C metal-binding domain-containing protein [Polyangia bacterium]
MAKPGRNDPCPCGSGKKYKKCCLPVHEAADAERARVRHLPAASVEQVYAEMDELDTLSNRANVLIKTGRFDEAATICDELERRYPDQIDFLDRRAQLYEARLENKLAAQYYRKALAFAASRDGFDEARLTHLRNRADALDPPPAPPIR